MRFFFSCHFCCIHEKVNHQRSRRVDPLHKTRPSVSLHVHQRTLISGRRWRPFGASIQQPNIPTLTDTSSSMYHDRSASTMNPSLRLAYLLDVTSHHHLLGQLRPKFDNNIPSDHHNESTARSNGQPHDVSLMLSLENWTCSLPDPRALPMFNAYPAGQTSGYRMVSLLDIQQCHQRFSLEVQESGSKESRRGANGRSKGYGYPSKVWITICHIPLEYPPRISVWHIGLDFHPESPPRTSN